MNWDQQALEAWLEESARKDEDAMTLAKYVIMFHFHVKIPSKLKHISKPDTNRFIPCSRYTRMDESKIKELSLKIEHLTDDSAKKRKILDQEVTETLTAQVNIMDINSK